MNTVAAAQFLSIYKEECKKAAEREFCQAVDRLLKHEDLCDLLETLSAHIGNGGKDIPAEASDLIHDCSHAVGRLD